MRLKLIIDESQVSMAAMLGSRQQIYPSVASGRVLLKPQPVVLRHRAVRSLSINATTKAPAQPVKITIQGRRLPVSGRWLYRLQYCW